MRLIASVDNSTDTDVTPRWGDRYSSTRETWPSLAGRVPTLEVCGF